MKAAHTLAAVGLLLLLSVPHSLLGELAATARAEQPTPPPAEGGVQQEADARALEQWTQDVEAFLHHYIQTLEGKDERAIRALFVSDSRFAWFTDGERSYASPAEVLEGMRRYAGIGFRTTLRNVRVVPLGPDLASADSAFVTELTIPGTAGHSFGGVITWLIERDLNSGDCKVLLGHTSTPSPRGGAVGDTERR